jgi:hypothetical protein
LDYLVRHIRFFRFKSYGEDWLRCETDPPGWLSKIIVAKPANAACLLSGRDHHCANIAAGRLARPLAPLRRISYASREDRGVIAAAILAATVRRTLPRVPGISFDAPSAGSGKDSWLTPGDRLSRS